MRGILIALAAAFALAIAAPAHANANTSSGAPQMAAPSTTVFALQQAPDKKIDIDINTHRGGGGRWYANPMWIAIGAVALIVVLLLVVLAARGGGTTIVKE